MKVQEIISEALLYRGDSSSIDKFLFSKTDQNALFGPGIYLTDDKTVAGDYTLKQSEHILFSDPDAKDARSLVAKFLNTIIETKLKWTDAVQKLKDEHVVKLEDSYTEDMTWADRQALAQVRLLYFTKAREKLRSKMLVKAKKIFIDMSPTMKIVKKTTGELCFVKKDREAYISCFDVPDSYLSKTLHAEKPLPDQIIAIIKKLFNDQVDGINADNNAAKKNGIKVSDDPVMDMRDANGDFCTFDNWIKAYKFGIGIDYAWAEEDRTKKGYGKNPDLSTIWSGTHFGSWYFLKNSDKFISAMKSLGYVGLEYDGGKRVGAYTRGGGGHEHHAYVFWNDDELNNFRVSTDSVGMNDADIDTSLSKSIRVKTK